MSIEIQTYTVTKSKSYDWVMDTNTAKEHLRILSGETADDTYIDSLIETATIEVEQYCEMDVPSGTTTYTYDWYKGSVLDIKEAPVVSISSVTYVDKSDNTGTLTDYQYQIYYDRVRIWFQNALDVKELTVVITTGYSTIPKPISQAILIKVADLYDIERNDYTLNPYKELKVIDRLLTPYKKTYLI